MLSGILAPTSGKISVNGITPYEDRRENAKSIGVVFGQRSQLWWDIPVCESFRLARFMYKIPKDSFEKTLEMLSEILEINQFFDVPVRQLSLGQRIRADICMALLHRPPLLFLDEPTIGLDVAVKEKIRRFIKEINMATNSTVILTTHDMSDIERLCNRVIVIDKGSLMYDGDLETLRKKYGNNETISLELESVSDAIEGIWGLNIADMSIENNKVTILYDSALINSASIIEWIFPKFKIIDFKVTETSIEEVIRNMYRAIGAIL